MATNDERAARAFRLALIYAHDAGPGEDIEAAIIDLSADLLHLCGQYGYEPEDLQRIALSHFRAEASDDLCACGEPVGPNGEHRGGYGAFCG